VVVAAVVAVVVGGVASAAGRSVAVPVWGVPVQSGTLGHGEPDEIRTVDVNGDGLRDVIVGPLVWERFDAQAPIFLVNKGQGKLVDETSQLFDGPPPLVEFDRELVVADFNGDHRPDIFIGDTGLDNQAVNPGYPGQQDRLILSTPEGKWRDASEDLPQQRSFTHSAAAADVNGDGHVDIFENNLGCCGRDRVPAEILLNDGSGHFTADPGLLHGFPVNQYGQTYSLACAFADVNGDGHPDLIVGGDEQVERSAVLVNDGTGNFTFFEWLPPKLYPPDALVMDIVPADVNGDGAVDLLTVETQSNPYYIGSRIQVLINDGHGHFADETSTWMPHEPVTQSWPDRLLTEDVNDDGKPDLTIQYASNGRSPTPVWLNTGTSLVPITPPRNGAFISHSGLGPVGYINGDGPHALVSIEYADSNGGTPNVYVTPQLVALAAPTGLTASRTRSSGIHITWLKTPNATEYILWRAPQSSGRFSRIATTTATSFTDQTVTHSRSYQYAVAARGAAGTSPLSSPVTGRRR
jgi:hypothetical protein